MGNVGQTGETGVNTLEETLELAKRRVDYAADNPSTGSGTPYLDASGVLGASVIAGAVFGGIANSILCTSKTRKILRTRQRIKPSFSSYFSNLKFERNIYITPKYFLYNDDCTKYMFEYNIVYFWTTRT